MSKRRSRKPARKKRPVKKPKAKKATRKAARAKKLAPKAPEAASTPKLEAEEVKVTAAKGRPMLTWVGKRPLTRVKAFPAQLVESYDALSIVGMSSTDRDTYGERMDFLRTLRKHVNDECWRDQPEVGLRAPENGGFLFHGDNKEVLAYLLANGFRGKVDLVYIDPPFDSGADYVRKVSLRGPKGTAKLAGEGYTLGEQIQYTDIWANDNYLQFVYERLLLLKEILVDTGVIIVHLDWHRHPLIRLVLDEIFGPNGFVNHVVWHYFGFKRKTSGNYPRKHDDILVYAKSDDYTWNPQFRPYSEEYLSRWKRDENGRLYRDDVNPTGGGTRTIYLDETEGDLVDSVWDDIPPVNPVAKERMDYPTQKPEALVERFLATCTNPGDIVLDCFIGCGTTAAVAQKLGRRWIGCDINKGAIQTTAKRLQGVIAEQIEAARKAAGTDAQGNLFDESKEGEETPPKPTGFGFTVWRVNDYDLQVQHNEAVNLACEHLGVTRTRSDPYFDGVRGKKLVKIVPFSHPLTPLDLEELKRELDARPEEDRNITVVCLGIELAAQAWVEDWNRLRKGRGAVNRIDVIELRSDPNYGGFIQHRPAQARVKIARKRDKITVEIEDFISPGIVERLKSQAGVVAPKIDDWRAMVDCVMIDTAYDGEVFNVALSDVPAKKADLVQGKYDLPAPEGKTTVAVKIIDMLGEEVLVISKA